MIQARAMAFHNKWLTKSLSAIIAIVIIAAGSLAYFIASPSTNTQPNSSSDRVIKDNNSGQAEVRKPIADVPASNKPPLNVEASRPPADAAVGPKEKSSPNLSRLEESIIAENTKDPILYIYVVSQLSGKGLRGMPVLATLTNSTNRCGGGGQVPSGAVILPNGTIVLPNGSIITFPPCLGPTSYTTNSTGYAVIPVANAKFYWITFGIGMRDPSNPLWEELVPVQANQSKVVTTRVNYDPDTLDFTAILFREGNSTRWRIYNDSAGRDQTFVWEHSTRKHGPEISNITVKLGQTVRIMILNMDAMTPHGFVLPDFKIFHLQGGLPPEEGRDVIFSANKVGKFKFYCSLPDEVVNGVLVKHSEEVGWLIVEP